MLQVINENTSMWNAVVNIFKLTVKTPEQRFITLHNIYLPAGVLVQIGNKQKWEI